MKRDKKEEKEEMEETKEEIMARIGKDSYNRGMMTLSEQYAYENLIKKQREEKEKEEACCVVRCPTRMEFCYMMDLISFVSSMVFSVDLAQRDIVIGITFIAYFITIHSMVTGMNCEFCCAFYMTFFRIVNICVAIVVLSVSPMASFTANVTMPIVIAVMAINCCVIGDAEYGPAKDRYEQGEDRWQKSCV